MPLLSTSRFTRPARGLVAVLAVGAFGGPVGSAGAGVPAALPATPSIALGATSTATPRLVTDLLGTHTGAALGPLGFDKARKAAVAAPSATQVCSGTQFGGGFTTKLGSTWTSLAARAQACTSSAGQGTWTSGVNFSVSKEMYGQFICRGSTYGYGSSVWFKTSKGWVWSGGTANPRWGGSC